MFLFPPYLADVFLRNECKPNIFSDNLLEKNSTYLRYNRYNRNIKNVFLETCSKDINVFRTLKI